MLSSSINPTTNSFESNVLNIINPYYLGLSNNSCSVLISNVFNGVGFATQKRSMTIALTSMKNFSFVDGTITQPSVDSSDYPAWQVISWILNYLHKNIVESVLFLQTAHEIQKELNQRYGQCNSALIYQIQQKLYSIFQKYDDFFNVLY